MDVLWMTTGLSCDCESVAMTSATSPSIEDIVGGVISGFTEQGQFADDYLPWGNTAANFQRQRFTYGPFFRYFRKRNLSHKFEQEPGWRKPGRELSSGFEKTW